MSPLNGICGACGGQKNHRAGCPYAREPAPLESYLEDYVWRQAEQKLADAIDHRDKWEKTALDAADSGGRAHRWAKLWKRKARALYRKVACLKEIAREDAHWEHKVRAELAKANEREQKLRRVLSALKDSAVGSLFHFDSTCQVAVGGCSAKADLEAAIREAQAVLSEFP